MVIMIIRKTEGMFDEILVQLHRLYTLVLLITNTLLFGKMWVPILISQFLVSKFARMMLLLVET